MFLLCPPNLLRRRPFLERENVCNSQETGVRTRCAAIVNHPAVLKILRVVNLLRVLFLVRRGPLGSPAAIHCSVEGQPEAAKCPKECLSSSFGHLPKGPRHTKNSTRSWVTGHFSGKSNLPLTPILLKSIAIHLPFLWHTLAKVCPPPGRK